MLGGRHVTRVVLVNYRKMVETVVLQKMLVAWQGGDCADGEIWTCLLAWIRKLLRVKPVSSLQEGQRIH